MPLPIGEDLFTSFAGLERVAGRDGRVGYHNPEIIFGPDSPLPQLEGATLWSVASGNRVTALATATGEPRLAVTAAGLRLCTNIFPFGSRVYLRGLSEAGRPAIAAVEPGAGRTLWTYESPDVSVSNLIEHEGLLFSGTPSSLEAISIADGKSQVLHQIRQISNLANFCYVRQSEALGLGHAVLCAQHLIGDEPFAVILGDEIIHAPVPALAQLIHVYKKRHGAVLGVQEVPKQDVSRYGIVSPKRVTSGLHHVLDMVEKPSPADAPSTLAVIGRYVLPPDCLMLKSIRPIEGSTESITFIAKDPSGPGFQEDAGDTDTTVSTIYYDMAG